MSKPDPCYSNGNLRFRGETIGDQMHGFWEFFRADGSLMRSGSFDHGVQVGEWTTYDRAGHIVKVTTFRSAD